MATEFELLQQSRVKQATKPNFFTALKLNNTPMAVSAPPRTSKLEEMVEMLVQHVDRLEKSPAKTQAPAKG